jgi:hypothetical protein
VAAERTAVTAERWEKIERIFESALVLPVSRREAHVRAACGCDCDLFDEIVAMLSTHERTGGPSADPMCVLPRNYLRTERASHLRRPSAPLNPERPGRASQYPGLYRPRPVFYPLFGGRQQYPRRMLAHSDLATRNAAAAVSVENGSGPMSSLTFPPGR